MSVLGVGIDVVGSAGFAEQLDQPGSRFAAGAFTGRERAEAHRGSGDPVLRLAGRWAAKEAFVKAWSTARLGAPPDLDRWDPAEVEVVADAEGRPALALHGAVADAVAARWGDRLRSHLSISHDGPVAAAVVVLELAEATATGAGDGAW